MAIITISRQIGSWGDEIAQRVGETLDYQYFDKQLMDEIATKIGLLEREVVDFSGDNYKVKSLLERLLNTQGPLFNPSVFTSVEDWEAKGPSEVKEVGIWTEDTTGAWTKVVQKIGEEESVNLVNQLLLAASKKGNLVIVGRGGQVLLQEMSGVLHVRIVAPRETRIQRMQQREHISLNEAKKRVEDRDRAAADYLKRFHKADISDPLMYDLTINTAKIAVETAVDMIVTAVKDLPSAGSSE